MTDTGPDVPGMIPRSMSTPTTDHKHELCTEVHRHPSVPHLNPFARPHCVECGEPMPEPLAQTWCDKCDQPATRSIELTNGETAFRCSEHAWLLVAPRGAHV